MARKTLLTEGEIRQFMKLANLEPLGAAKIEEMFGENEEITEQEEEELEETKDSLEEEEELEEMGMRGAPMDRDEEEVMDDADMEMDAAADDMGDAEMDMDAADDMGDDAMDVGGMDDAAREEVMADVVRAVAQALGI